MNPAASLVASCSDSPTDFALQTSLPNSLTSSLPPWSLIAIITVMGKHFAGIAARTHLAPCRLIARRAQLGYVPSWLITNDPIMQRCLQPQLYSPQFVLGTECWGEGFPESDWLYICQGGSLAKASPYRLIFWFFSQAIILIRKEVAGCPYCSKSSCQVCPLSLADSCPLQGIAVLRWKQWGVLCCRFTINWGLCRWICPLFKDSGHDTLKARICRCSFDFMGDKYVSNSPL